VAHDSECSGCEIETSGGSLAERLAQGPLPLAFALRYAAEVAGMLRALHQNGRYHGDVDPAYIRISNGEAILPPPNGHSHLANQRTDISAFGAVLFEMVTGSKPSGSQPGADLETAHAGPGGLRFSATRLAARCLGTTPDRPSDMQKVATEVRLLGVLARQQGETETTGTKIPETAPPSSDESPSTGAAPEGAESSAAHSSHEERCPRCGTHLTASSRPRSTFEAMLPFLGMPILRCGRCYHRYVIFFGLPFAKAARV
jgi:hypothetical protein